MRGGAAIAASRAPSPEVTPPPPPLRPPPPPPPPRALPPPPPPQPWLHSGCRSPPKRREATEVLRGVDRPRPGGARPPKKGSRSDELSPRSELNPGCDACDAAATAAGAAAE
eukprot:scaffold15829_cov21-Phaeocystis_antarctica.AAC.1